MEVTLPRKGLKKSHQYDTKLVNKWLYLPSPTAAIHSHSHLFYHCSQSKVAKLCKEEHQSCETELEISVL